MSTITIATPALGEVPVLSGYVLFPIRGAWTSTVELHGVIVPAEGDPATITFYEESTGDNPAPAPAAFVGVVRRADTALGPEQVVVSVVGGAGGLSTPLEAVEHITGTTPIPLGLIVNRVLEDAGEQLGAGVAAALDVYTVTRWHRLGGLTARNTLELLLYLVGLDNDVDLGWRVQADGTIWAGVETWPTGTTARYMAPDLDDGRIIYAPDGATLLPGTTVDGHQLVEVLYTLLTPALRAEARHSVAGDPPRRVELAPYARTYPATVDAQNATTGLLDLVFEDVLVGDMRSAPFRMGIPGATAAIPLLSLLRVRFEGADPRAPYAFDFDPIAYGTGSPLGLVGDLVCYLSATCAAAPGPVTLTASATPTGHAGEVKLTLAGPGAKYARGLSGP